VFAVPSDGDWSMWPSSPTYAPVLIDLVDYLVGDANSTSNLKIGNPILLPVDLAVHQSRVGLRNPKDERIEAVARPYRTNQNSAMDVQTETGSKNTPASSDALDGVPAIAFDNDLGKKSDSNSAVAPAKEAGSDTAHAVRFDNVLSRGFYQAELKQHAGKVEQVLFAANFDPRESRLTRLSSSVLESSFFSEKVLRVSPSQLTGQAVAAGNSEIWPLMLIVLFCVLVAEQSLAWLWGRKR
jgi:hypothetical protein